MNSDIREALRSVDIGRWRSVSVEFGAEILDIAVPPDCETLSMRDAPVLADPGRAFAAALASPFGTPPLEEIVRGKGKPPSELSVAVSVSDITRPVPYKGEGGLLRPLLAVLEGAGIRRKNLVIVVGTGMHRASTAGEKLEMFGEPVVAGYRIVDHDCEDASSLVHIGRTASGTAVHVNAVFAGSDLRVVTGLVESHFMAGVSGGRKGICPALVDKRTIQRFHSPEFLESPRADNLILDGNPCHLESLEIARTVGVDFLVNVTLDKDMRLTGVFAGHLEEAHRAAVRSMSGTAAIPIDREFDIVLTHSGYAGRNHYQSAKAGCSAAAAVKTGGTIVLAADNRDPEPVGSIEYRHLLGRFKALGGIEGYLEMLRDPGWTFTKDQWEPEVWGRVTKKVGNEGLIYCSPQISGADSSLLPGLSGLDFLDPDRGLAGREAARAMVQNALIFAVHRSMRKGGGLPSVAFLREGPYGVPVLSGPGASYPA